MPQKPPLLSWSNAEAKSFSMTLSLPSIRFRLVSRPCCSTGCVQFSFLPYIVYIYPPYIITPYTTYSPENFLLPHSRLSIMAVGWLVGCLVGRSRTLFANLALSQHPTSFRAECACAKNQATKTIFTTVPLSLCVCVCLCVFRAVVSV